MMNVGLCYESVLPARGGCEHYIGDLSRRLARDGHAVHLFACRWDASALPSNTIYHQLPTPRGPRFRRPWQFGKSCEQALIAHPVDVSMGFDKTWGQDVLYPQGGLHSASRAHNLLKSRPGLPRLAARVARLLDPTSVSFARLEHRQYMVPPRPIVVVNSLMVQRHFREYLGIGEKDVRVVRSSIDPDRFACDDRPAARARERAAWGYDADDVVGLFVGMNYRLKGLEQLVRAVAKLPESSGRTKFVVIGGAKYDRYAALARKLGVSDRIRFLGFRSDPRDAFFAADFLVHPTFYDPCSLVALEALGCGLPVVTTQYNGASELLSPPKDGMVVKDPHNAHELAQAIATIASPTELPQRKIAAAEAGNQWTFEEHYHQLMSILQEAAARRAQAQEIAR